MGILRGSIRIAVVVALLLAVLVARVVTSSRTELETADRLLAAGDWDSSVIHYRRAARWYAPGSPYHVTALTRLFALGARAEKQRDTERALTAYRSVRAAILSARSFYTPEGARLKAANEKIAALTASLRPPAIDGTKSFEQRRREHLALLQTRYGPNIFWSWILLAGFIAWVSGAYAFTIYAIDAQDRWIGREARRWGTAIVLGLGLFILGLALA
jgi:hypothetical protein